MSSNPFVYVAARGFEKDLTDELELHGIPILEAKERLILADGFFRSAWAQNIWLEPVFYAIRSVGDAVHCLKGIQRNWKSHPIDFFRRASLIEAQLPPIKNKPFAFGNPIPTAPLGAWTLWDRDMLLYSAQCTSPFADGEVFFAEDKINPPSRAYLKLWESFTLIGEYPKQGALCVDLGSAPGGWTWVLAKLGTHVFSLDKSPLDPRVSSMPNVDHCIGSGFGLEPQSAGRIDWLFSDMACYPERLLHTVRQWLGLDAFANAVCTIKLQGATDHAIVDAFRNIPGSKVLHLSCNKHELTWINLEKWRKQ